MVSLSIESTVLSTYWIEKRKPHWARLETLLANTQQHGVGALTRNELRELGLLYRQTAADLSTAREDPGSQNYARYLNQLLGKAHNVIYTGRRSDPSGIVRFYAHTYPQVFRQTLPYTVAAFAIFLAGALTGALLSLRTPQFEHFLLGGQMMDTIERHQMWTHSIVAIKPLASSAIMTNNLAVTLTTFALGITAGVGTVYMMLFNGLLLGVVGMACWQADMSLSLWSFVAPHGVLELPAIFIAGGAGLNLARGLLFPGFLPRRASVAQAGAVAVRLVLGCIPILVVAGVIEGFVSPSDLPPQLKLLFAGVMACLFFSYLFGAGRKEDSTVKAGSAP